MFGQRQRLRTIARHMLVVWVLALLFTVVHACVVPPLAQAATDGVVHDCHEAAAADAGDVLASESAPKSGTKSACAKFCDEDASSAPSSQRLASDAGSSLGLALWPTLALAVQATLEPQRVFVMDPGRLPPALPVSIAFLRLTL